MMIDMLIPIEEYAKKHGKAVRSVRQKCQLNGFSTAQKIGRNWLIDENEPYIDKRRKSAGTDELLERNILDEFGAKIIGKYYCFSNEPCEVLDAFGKPFDCRALPVEEQNRLDNDIDVFEEGFNQIIDGYEVLIRYKKWTIRRRIHKIEFFDAK